MLLAMSLRSGGIMWGTRPSNAALPESAICLPCAHFTSDLPSPESPTIASQTLGFITSHQVLLKTPDLCSQGVYQLHSREWENAMGKRGECLRDKKIESGEYLESWQGHLISHYVLVGQREGK